MTAIRTETLAEGVIFMPGDAMDRLKEIETNSVDSFVTDAPYGLGKEPTADEVLKMLSAWLEGGHYNVRSKSGFMGKEWDAFVPQPAVWREVYRVLKPGAHVVAFFGTRTYDLGVMAMRIAGFEVRDLVAWLYGTGFPKSHDVSKGIDKIVHRLGMFGPFAQHYAERRAAAGLTHNAICDAGRFYAEHNHGGASVNWEQGHNVPTRAQWSVLQPLLGLSDEFLPLIERVEAEREKVGERDATLLAVAPGQDNDRSATSLDITAPATDAAREWEGWGTALKPAFEPIVLARKPLGTGDIRVRENVEREIKSRGWKGEIKWLDESAGSATRPNNPKASLRTPSNAETSAVNADERQTTHTAPPMAINSAGQAAIGTRNTDRNTSTQQNDDTASYATKSLGTTVASAHVAVNANPIFSPSTISMAAEHSTENRSAEKFMPTCANEAFPQDSERFAGIATGLTDSIETVHIRRQADSFVWPENLPTFVPSRPLTVAANVLRWRTGALNIGACRVPAADQDRLAENWNRETVKDMRGGKLIGGMNGGIANTSHAGDGRWPANVVHDSSDEVVGAFPNTSPGKSGGKSTKALGRMNDDSWVAKDVPRTGHDDAGGSAARFFYSAKADDEDRVGSKHPTIKPVDLMRYLARLVTPPGGLVVDPFAGTGTTGEACIREKLNVILIEKEREYQEDIRRRIKLCFAGPDERARETIKAKNRDKPVDHGPLFAAE